MGQEKKNNKTKWGIPAVILIIIIVIRLLYGIKISPEILFFGCYVTMAYNIWYYRKTSKRPVVEFLLVQPFGVLGVILLLPKESYDLLIGPTVLFVFGSMFAMMGGFYLKQEKDKRKNCDCRTIAVVIGNIRKKTRNRGRAYSYSPIVRYYIEGQVQEATYGDGFPSPKPAGQKVEILYNKKEPEEFCFADQKQVRIFMNGASLFVLVGLILLIAAVVILRRRFAAP